MISDTNPVVVIKGDKVVVTVVGEFPDNAVVKVNYVKDNILSAQYGLMEFNKLVGVRGS